MNDIFTNKDKWDSEIEETENLVEIGDGDGINEFDDTVKSMNEGNDYICYPEVESSDNKKGKNSFDFTTDEKVDEVIATMSDEREMKFIPKSDGDWTGEKGDSKWIPDDAKIPGKANPEEKSWGQIKKEFEIDGINFKNAEPDFSEIARGEAHIEDFSDNRDCNFKQADEKEALKRGCSPEDVKEWRKENGYTWHERKDCETMDKVPSIVHNNVFHSGGISEKKKEISMEDWIK